LDIVIITFVVTIVFFVIYKYDIFKSLSTKGVIEKDFSQCYILNYPRRIELHNKGVVYEIKDLDEFFELNPKLKGKIPIEKREGINASDPDAVKKEFEERKRLKEKYSQKKKKK
jgi:hypothetical protein